MALRAIRARPLRAALTTVAVALGIAAILGVEVTMNGLDSESHTAVQAQAGDSGLDVRVTAGQGFSADQLAALSRISGVTDIGALYDKRVTARLSDADINGSTVDLLALHHGEVGLRPVALVSGRLPSAGNHSEVVLDQGLAEALAAAAHRKPLAVGETIQLTTGTGPDTFIISGFSQAAGGAAAFTRSGVYISEEAVLNQFSPGLHTAMVSLRLRSGTSSDAIAKQVQQRLGAAATSSDPRAVGSQPLRDVQPLLLLVTVLALIVGAGATANSVALAASERRRETGLLRAAGASARQVFRLFMVEMVTLALAAVPLGIGAGVGLAALLDGLLTPTALPAPPLMVSWWQVVLAAVVGAAAALLGAAIPARSSGKAGILTSLRPHPSAARDRLNAFPLALSPLALILGAVLFVLGNSTAVAFGVVVIIAGVLCALPLLAPLTARLVGTAATVLTAQGAPASRNLARRRNRTALTLAGLTISVATAVAVSALSAGALAGGDEWVSHLFGGNMVVRSPVTQTEAVQRAIESVNGVRSAVPLRFLTVASGRSAVGLTEIDTPSYDGAGALEVTQPTRAQALRSIDTGPAVLVPTALVASKGWGVGSTVPLSTMHGTVSFAVAGVVQHSFPSGDGSETLIVDRQQALRYFGDTAAGFDDLDVVSNGNSAAVRDAAAQFGLAAVSVDDIRGATHRALEHAIGLLFAVAIVALVTAMIAVVNTLTVNIRQGTRELSVLRAVGLDRARARRLVLVEAAVLAASGAVIGLVTGCVIVVGMLRAVSSPGFTPGFVFPTAAAIAVVAAVIGGSVIATLVPSARVARHSIVAAIRQD